MPNDLDGSKYRGLIKLYSMHSATRTPLTKALQTLAIHVGGGLGTESTAAVGYCNKTLYVSKLSAVRPPADYVEQIKNLLTAPLDGTIEETLSVFNDSGSTPITSIVGVGGGKTGLHAEMMICKQIGGMDPWGANFYFGVAIAASQGACPACAGFMNLKNIWHTGVRANGRVSSRWINPFDDTVCGSEVGLGLRFGDVAVHGGDAWVKDW